MLFKRIGESGGDASEEKRGCATDLTFGYEINAATLTAELEAAAEELKMTMPNIELSNPDWDGRSNKAYHSWTLAIDSTEADAEKILTHLSSSFDGRTVWLSSSKIGSQVAGDTKNLAVAALLTSLLGIIAYIWIRFQRVVFG